MSNDQTKTTGTPNPSEGEPPETVETPAPEAEGREVESGGKEEPDWKTLYLTEGKPAQEERNRLKARVAELEDRPQPPPAVTGAELDARAERRAKIEAAALAGDWAAQELLELEAKRESDLLDQVLLRQLDKVPVEEQEDTLKHFQKNRHRFGDIKAARSDLREKSLEAELKAAQDKLAAFDRRPDPDVMNAPPTHGREVSARESKQKEYKSWDEFDAEQARLESEGNLVEKLKRQKALASGQVKVRG